MNSQANNLIVVISSLLSLCLLTWIAITCATIFLVLSIIQIDPTQSYLLHFGISMFCLVGLGVLLFTLLRRSWKKFSAVQALISRHKEIDGTTIDYKSTQIAPSSPVESAAQVMFDIERIWDYGLKPFLLLLSSIQRYPLTSCGLGLASGVLLGRALPLYRRRSSKVTKEWNKPSPNPQKQDSIFSLLKDVARDVTHTLILQKLRQLIERHPSSQSPKSTPPNYIAKRTTNENMVPVNGILSPSHLSQFDDSTIS